MGDRKSRWWKRKAKLRSEAIDLRQASQEDLLAQLKAHGVSDGLARVAKQTLLWERAVTQRLRSQLDMAEAWSPPDSAEEVYA
eukprot:Skav201073  [mRNA]  locus=scaffold963:82137:87187:+ [translate_table: standard]